MLRTALAITAFFWLSMAPSLCTAGLLAHACEVFVFASCDDSCDDEHGPDHHEDGCSGEDVDHSHRSCLTDLHPDDHCSHDACSHDACSHDACSHDACSHDACSHDSCGSDPCVLAVLVQQHRHAKISYDGDSLAKVPLHVSTADSALHSLTWQRFVRPLVGQKLPYFSSDRPLRS